MYFIISCSNVAGSALNDGSSHPTFEISHKGTRQIGHNVREWDFVCFHVELKLGFVTL